MENNDDFILDMLNESEKNNTKFDSDVDPKDITFKRDEKGILWSYDMKTGKKIGRIYEHGDQDKSVAKTFDELNRG